MRIEPATAADLDDLADAWVDLAATQRDHGSHLHAGSNRETIRPLLAQHVVAGTLLVARRDVESGGETGVRGPDSGDGGDANEVIGFVNFGLEEGGLASDATRGIVHNLYVEPESRGRGVGTALLDAAESALAERGADVIAIEALRGNEGARRLYRRRGYEPHRVQYEWTVGGEVAGGGDATPEDDATATTGESDTNTKDGA